MEAVALVPLGILAAIFLAYWTRKALEPVLRRWEGSAGTDGPPSDPEPVDERTRPVLYMRRAEWDAMQARINAAHGVIPPAHRIDVGELSADRLRAGEADWVEGRMPNDERPREQWPTYDH